MKKREVRAFDYVNHPYEPVRDALRAGAGEIFNRATKLAENRTGDLVASLSVDLAGIQISKDIEIHIGEISEERMGTGELGRVTRIPLEWRAKETPGLFPAMQGTLSVYPLSFTETQLELSGHYDPPMGVLGSALDAVVGHRLAEASVHRFVGEVVELLRRDMP
jgi:hypothetical protein